jgi:hypothetical protein
MKLGALQWLCEVLVSVHLSEWTIFDRHFAFLNQMGHKEVADVVTEIPLAAGCSTVLL